MKSLILITVLGFVPILALAQNNTQRFISVSGTSEISIDPDSIELTITYSENENLKRENELQQKEAALISLLKSFSIDIKKLKITNFKAYRNGYGYFKSSPNRIRVSKDFILQLDNIEIIDNLVLKLFEAGADNIIITNLKSSLLEDTKLEVTRIALDKATSKAKTMASHLNCSLGQVLEISEGTPKILRTRNNFSLYESSLGAARAASSSYSAESLDIGIQKIKVRYTVQVKYELK